MEGQIQIFVLRDKLTQIQESLRIRIQMEGHGEREFRELLAQVQENMRELDDVEERWGGTNPEERRARMHEIHQWIIESVERIGEIQRQALAIRAAALPPRTTVTISISGEHISDNNSVTSSCPICYDDFKFGEDAVQLNCGHVYHPNCISSWMRRPNNCPVCGAYQ